MKYSFDWVADKNGWKILVIDGRSLDANLSLWLTDQEALRLYKFIGENFNVEEISK